MIAFVKGTLTDISALGAVVDVGGVGMNLLTSANALKGKKVGDQVQVPTVMVVREDHMTLYGVFVITNNFRCGTTHGIKSNFGDG